MAWTYSDYLTLTGTARLTRLRLHVKEVADRISDWQSQAVGGELSGSRFQVQDYLQSLKSELVTLEASLGVAPAARTIFTRGVAV